jgi:hypothetical protein
MSWSRLCQVAHVILGLMHVCTRRLARIKVRWVETSLTIVDHVKGACQSSLLDMDQLCQLSPVPDFH